MISPSWRLIILLIVDSETFLTFSTATIQNPKILKIAGSQPSLGVTPRNLYLQWQKFLTCTSFLHITPIMLSTHIPEGFKMDAEYMKETNNIKHCRIHQQHKALQDSYPVSTVMILAWIALTPEVHCWLKNFNYDINIGFVQVMTETIRLLHRHRKPGLLALTVVEGHCAKLIIQHISIYYSPCTVGVCT